MTYLFLVPLILFTGAVGSYAALRSFQGGSPLWPLATGQMSLLLWVLITRQRLHPWAAAVMFDGLYYAAFYSAMLLQGQPVTPYQAAGALLMVSGVLLAGVKG